MNWFLVQSSLAGKQIQAVFYSDIASASAIWGSITQLAGYCSMFIWTNNSWQQVPASGAVTP